MVVELSAMVGKSLHFSYDPLSLCMYPSLNSILCCSDLGVMQVSIHSKREDPTLDLCVPPATAQLHLTFKALVFFDYILTDSTGDYASFVGPHDTPRVFRFTYGESE